ncbi:MAG: signal recognition particle-docking protein FtsY [Bdellovibrionaceae bacterium]|nr:signal recognition particle-docking protein FtsY [Pseudobdellovibrionaceae bacterium]
MISPGESSALQWLLLFIAVLLLVILSPLIKRLITQLRLSPKEGRQEFPTSLELPQTHLSAPLQQILSKTEENIFGRIRGLFSKNSPPHLEEIEEVLYTADLGPKAVQKLTTALEKTLSGQELRNLDQVREVLHSQIKDIFSSLQVAAVENGGINLRWAHDGPTVFLIVGVNGAGKTTTIGKFAAMFASQGKKVLVAAGDTFRAAASEQLRTWTERASVEIFSPPGVSDPSAVAFDALQMARAKAYDLVLIDTAGRLHTQEHLMQELAKVRRVITKVIPEAPHETLVVLDANNGQNALVQARQFNEVVPLTGAILTKMDGTAKGGVAVGLAAELGLPVKFIGVGERISDLRPFSTEEFIRSICP